MVYRWATHGGKTDENAHPHQDRKERVAVVHNGTITNSYELRMQLQKKGIHLASETDTEVMTIPLERDSKDFAGNGDVLTD